MNTPHPPRPMDELVFQDIEGKSWDLKINMYIAGLIDASDFSELTKTVFSFISPEKEFLQEIYTNTPLSMGLIWAIVQDQIEDNMIRPRAEEEVLRYHEVGTEDKVRTSASIKVEIEEAFENLKQNQLIDWELEFIKRIDGDALQSARTSLLRALADFFPLHRIVLSQFLNEQEKLIAMTNLQIQTILPELSEHLEKEVTEACQQLKKELKSGKPLLKILGTD